NLSFGFPPGSSKGFFDQASRLFELGRAGRTRPEVHLPAHLGKGFVARKFLPNLGWRRRGRKFGGRGFGGSGDRDGGLHACLWLLFAPGNVRFVPGLAACEKRHEKKNRRLSNLPARGAATSLGKLPP